MGHRITERWNDKRKWFRDHEQADRVGTIILERLADDRVQEECRYLCRLRWHLFMVYQEVSYEELQEYVSQDKMAVLNDLFSSIAASDYDGIDSWIERCERALPIIVDKWRKQNPDRAADSTRGEKNLMAPFWLNAVLRSLVWLGATVLVAFLKQPDGVNFAAIRAGFAGWLGIGLLVAGLALHFWSNASLARGEYETSRGSDTLVAYGPYRFVRHPVYLAGIPLLLGAGMLYSPLVKADLVGGLVLLVYFHLRVVRAEEPALRRRFGPRYEEYCRRVPRWLPRLGLSTGAGQQGDATDDSSRRN